MLSKARNMISILITFFISLMYKGREESKRERIQYGVPLESVCWPCYTATGCGPLHIPIHFFFISPVSPLFTLGDLAAVGANYKWCIPKASEKEAISCSSAEAADFLHLEAIEYNFLRGKWPKIETIRIIVSLVKSDLSHPIYRAAP
jgi:hypothetical protein